MALNSKQEKIISLIGAILIAFGFIKLIFWAVGVALSVAFIMAKIVLFSIILIVIAIPSYIFINKFLIKKR